MRLICLVCGVLSGCSQFVNVPLVQGHEPTINLNGVPDRLTFPLPEGSNVVLTATVSGGAVETVYLMRDRDGSEDRPARRTPPGPHDTASARKVGERRSVRLTPLGEGKYQINLADPAVLAEIRRGGSSGSFRIMATTADKRLISSIAVCYAVTVAPPPDAVVRAVRGGQAATSVTCEYYTWLAPHELDRLEVVWEGAAAASARATAGQRSWDFTPGREPGCVALPLSSDIREAWERAGLLKVTCGYGEDTARVLRWLRAIPSTLNASGNLVKVTVYQRSSKFVPASNQYLSLHLEDITRGQVLVTLDTAEGQRLVDTESLRPGAAVDFEFGGQRYTLKAEQLVNELIGADYGVFSVSHLRLPEREKIDRLLERVEQSGLIFIRNGEEHNSLAAAAHWRRKFEAEGPRVNTLEEFIEKIASRSSLSDQPYQVRLSDGTVAETGPWLRAQVTTLSAPQGTGEPASAPAPPEANPR